MKNDILPSFESGDDEIIHNNIKSSGPRITALAQSVNSNEYMNQMEKGRCLELLDFCKEMTNGRSAKQKIQDLTETTGQIAAFAIERRLDALKLDKDIDIMEENINKKIDNVVKQVEDKFGEFIDRLDTKLEEKFSGMENKISDLTSNLTEVKTRCKTMDERMSRLDERIDDTHKRISKLQVSSDKQDADLKQEVQKVENEIKVKTSTTSKIGMISKLINDQPALSGCICMAVIFAICYSSNFVDVIKQLVSKIL